LTWQEERVLSDVDRWLSEFERALSSGDSEAAAALFEEESFWRDLVAFTWNLKTLEGPDEIKRMLDAQLEHIQPSNWHTTEPPDTADGITTAWIAFETATGRGNGLLRLRDGRAWTLLTALYELKGHEEPKGTHRP
jgi:putative flavoprotein involved in K+ transport